MKQRIDWEKMTIQEAQDLATQLASAFSLTAKCYGTEGTRDVSYLTVESRYDDQLHSAVSRAECAV